MRTTVDLDDRLLKEAMARSRAKTKRETIERGLQELIKAERIRGLISMRGKGYGMSLREFLRTRADE
jgi:Arc/MetJ family transcription regulator